MRAVFVEDPNRWNELVLRHSTGNVLQSFEWGEIKARFGWHPVRLGIEDGSELVAGIQLLIRRLPLGAVAYSPRGPIVDFCNQSYVELLLRETCSIARSCSSAFVKIEPPIRNSPEIESVLESRGFIRGTSVQPRSTIEISLEADLATLSAALNPRTRYNIGLAKRKGVTVEVGQESELKDFYRLLVETSRRSGFAIHQSEYYRAVWSILNRKGMAHLLLAKFQGKPLAAAILLVAGKTAYYMYSASANEYRNLKPNDILQWECIKLAKDLGCVRYDLWGIPDEVGEAAERGVDLPDPKAANGDEFSDNKSTMWGVYRFKRGFGGKVVRYAGAYDRVYSRVRRWAYTAVTSASRTAVWPAPEASVTQSLIKSLIRRAKAHLIRPSTADNAVRQAAIRQ